MSQLTHIRLLVDDFAQNFFFYRDVMGFAYRAGDETGPYVEFYAGEKVMLGLFRRDYMAQVAHTADKPTHMNTQDSFVLCFAVPNVDEAVTQLKARGVVMINEPMNMDAWSLRVAHFRDPQGHLIEISHDL